MPYMSQLVLIGMIVCNVEINPTKYLIQEDCSHSVQDTTISTES